MALGCATLSTARRTLAILCRAGLLPGSLGRVSRKRGARLIEGLDDGSVVGLDRDSFGGERTVSVGRAEWTVRRSLFVQARGDHDVVEDSCLAFKRPERAALDQARRDVVQLLPTFQAPPWASTTVSSRSLMTGPPGFAVLCGHQIAAHDDAPWPCSTTPCAAVHSVYGLPRSPCSTIILSTSSWADWLSASDRSKSRM